MKNNKNKAKLIINNKKHNLQEFLKIKNIPNNNIKIGMIFSKDLCKGSFMFENCNSLINLSFYDKIEIIAGYNLDRLNKFEERKNQWNLTLIVMSKSMIFIKITKMINIQFTQQFQKMEYL